MSWNTRIVRQKFLEKNLWKKCKKNVFYIHTNIVTKKGGKNKRYNFSRNTRIVRAKNFGKKIVGKKCEKNFLCSHEYRDQKMVGKNARNNISRNTRIVRAKNVGKKIVGKKFEKTFFIFTRISWPKNGGKTRETIFPETHE